MLGVPMTSSKFHDLLESLKSHYTQLYFITVKWQKLAKQKTYKVKSGGNQVRA